MNEEKEKKDEKLVEKEEDDEDFCPQCGSIKKTYISELYEETVCPICAICGS